LRCTAYLHCALSGLIAILASVVSSGRIVRMLPEKE
jgi:hypothetical protein